MRPVILTTILICTIIISASWGFLSHRTISQLAVYGLPDSLQKFYFRNMQELVKKSVDPDLRQKEDSTEKTKHFIDLDGPLYKNNALPDDWSKAVKKYTEIKLRKAGTLPWEIAKTKVKLTEAFQKRDKLAIILYSADLSHYVADAFVPLHTTKNFDGQLTNQAGLHGLWETECPQLFLQDYDLKQKSKAIYIANMNKEIWRVLRESGKLSKIVIENEKKVSLNFENAEKYKFQLKNGIEERKYSAQFIEKYNEVMAKQINERLLLSTEMISNLWYTAWVDAKKPDLTTLFTFSLKDGENLKKEQDAWLKNILINKKYLRAKNGNN